MGGGLHGQEGGSGGGRAVCGASNCSSWSNSSALSGCVLQLFCGGEREALVFFISRCLTGNLVLMYLLV